MKSSIALILALVMSGCITAQVDRALDAAADAETRIGKSGALALDGIATLTTALAVTSTQTGDAMGQITTHTNAALDSIAMLTSALADSTERTSAALALTTSHTSAALDLIASRTGATLDGASAIISDLRPAVQGLGPAVRDFAAITSEARGITADTRVNIESGWLTKRLLVGVAILVALSLLHSIISAWRLHRRVSTMHEEVRKLHHRTPPEA